MVMKTKSSKMQSQRCTKESSYKDFVPFTHKIYYNLGAPLMRPLYYNILHEDAVIAYIPRKEIKALH